MTERTKRALPYVGLAAALAVIVFLVYQQHQLEARLLQTQARLEWPHAGDYVPRFRAVSLSGDTLSVGAPESAARQLLLVFNTSCPYCRASLPAWKRLAEEYRGDRSVSVLGLATDPPADVRPYAREHGLEFPVTSFASPRQAALFRASTVPLTVVVASDGQVVYTWPGELSGRPAVLDSIRTALEAPRSTLDSVFARPGARPSRRGALAFPF